MTLIDLFILLINNNIRTKILPKSWSILFPFITSCNRIPLLFAPMFLNVSNKFAVEAKKKTILIPVTSGRSNSSVRRLSRGDMNEINYAYDYTSPAH